MALTLAQRAFAIAERLALAAALILRLCFLAGALTAGFAPLTFAHRAFAAAAILARPAALILRLLDALGDAEECRTGFGDETSIPPKN
jgi:hypothetical protein